MKVIVQDPIISDVIVAEPDKIQGHEVTDRLPFSEILQAVIKERQYKVLAALWPSMTTAHDLLRQAEKLSAQARKRSERRMEDDVFTFMQVWVHSGHFEEPLLSEMRRFPDGRIKDLIDRPRKPKKLENIASMGMQEIVDLSRALCNLEVENYTLQSAIQTLATWKDKKRASFIPLAEQVSSLWFLTSQHS